MNVIPAIDLLEGKAVRLLHGKRERVTVYSEAPWELARAYAAQGARALHVVDLDGAFDRARRQIGLVERVIAAFGPSQDPQRRREVQVGGGLRTPDDLAAIMGAGATRAVLGTAAARSPEMVVEACKAWPDRIVVAVDAIRGQVRVDGWKSAASAEPIELALRAAVWGASRILYTDISRDGTKEGPNVETTARLQRLVGPDTPVIASGGIGSLEHLRLLRRAGIKACVIGRALYDGAFTLGEALSVGDDPRAD
jgi:phosphoribosylformimino-5-aminoimidazole carboxamide ribotide isomerase